MNEQPLSIFASHLTYHFLSIRVIILTMQMNRGLTMNKDNKHGYWIYEKIEDSTSVTGYLYQRECKCSECGYQVNMEKQVCPNCGTHMDKEK